MTTKSIYRFQPSGLNSDFDFDNLTFAEYVLRMREIIEQTRRDLKTNRSELIIDANSPYEWIPQNKNARNPITKKFKRGVLLIHGLFDSPYILESVAKHFIRRDYLVRTILLPGHGTVPGDLLNVSFPTWLKATSFGVRSFYHDVDHLYVCGFSTGGTLSLCQAYQNDFIKGLILLAPAIQLRRQLAIISALNKLMVRTIGGIKWYSRDDTVDYAKYHSITLESAHQVHLLTKRLQALSEQKTLEIPIFMSASTDDEVLSANAAIDFFKKLTNPESRMNVYTTRPRDYGDRRITCFNSAYPAEKILNFSHVSIPVAPDHPHYGEFNDLQDLPDYVLPYNKYFVRKDKQNGEIFKGAITKENLQRYHLQRLYYNPDFYQMITRVDEFITSIEESLVAETSF
jgi:esterase/lipase